MTMKSLKPDPNLVLAQLRALGFSPDIETEPRRLIASVSGHSKVGKTHFAFTAPPPIFLINIDRGTEGVLGKFQRSSKKIYVYTVRVPKQAQQGIYETMWKEVKSRIELVCKMGEGTIVMDTCTEIYELARLAHFGKLEQVMPHHYSQVNSEWRKDVLSWIYDSTLSAVLIHKVKPKYVNNNRTSEYEVSGFGETGYLVQANITCYRELGPDSDTRFSLTIDDCRQNEKLIGKEIHGLPLGDSKPGELHIDPFVNFEFILGLVHGKARG